MQVVFVVFIIALVTIPARSASLNCRYFEVFNQHNVSQPPAMPCDVCLQAAGTLPNGSYYSGSYQITCFSGNHIKATFFRDNSCSKFFTESPTEPAYTATSGGVCDHITFKAFAANTEQHGDSCVKQAGYLEMAFVEGCYDSVHNDARNPVKSADLSCTDTASFEIKAYSEYGCSGTELNENRSTIYSGCHEGALLPNISVLNFNESLYLEIAECGSNKFPVWAIIVISVGGCLCCCGCCALLACLFARRGKGLNTGYVQTYG